MKKLIIELGILLMIISGLIVDMIIDFKRNVENGNAFWWVVSLVIGIAIGAIIYFGVDYLNKKETK